MKRLGKFLNLTNSDRHLLINTFILLGLIKIGLWLLPFQRLLQLLSTISQTSLKSQEIQRTDLGKIVGAVNVSSRYIPGGVKCLARALTTQVLMTRYGYSPELRIGVAKKEGGKLEAHAWVESQGQVVMGYLRELSSFTPLPSLEGVERL
ncbi:lasso peptide biosynthesis B2 protein [aff. Roholtiella sp. LEGE 12411]|uniref:lasso peptide biosynthesis B2 protein n=1 Tax=aff. Roholtiella sp. LEGE 12411 TaxID=1828822 RepID=UPI0018815050|nr:lasso peptide biosynthesis B2 protein [aff. Roholtiella sp. LEGE 12411]MBE9038101.1 lasso peptide biosynthesis B2 protein [aff. Roholtiella sp. LEGE 12411]